MNWQQSMILLLIVLLAQDDAMASCVSQHPRTVVVLLNGKANISCYGNTSNGRHHLPSTPQLSLNGRTATDRQTPEGISWKEIEISDTIFGFEVIVNATIENNGTTIQCIFSCASDVGHVIAVNSLPDPPDPPSAILLAPSIMEVSWDPPWPHPVNSYSVHITNTVYGNSSDYTAANTSLIITKELNTTCYELKLAVLANTDIGPSNLSDTTIKGFSQDIFTINVTNLEKQIQLIPDSIGKLHALIIELEPLPVCTYETLQYLFHIRKSQTNFTVRTEANSPNVTVINNGFLNLGDEVDVFVIVKNEGNQEIEIDLFANKCITLQLVSQFSTVPSSSSHSSHARLAPDTMSLTVPSSSSHSSHAKLAPNTMSLTGCASSLVHTKLAPNLEPTIASPSNSKRNSTSATGTDHEGIIIAIAVIVGGVIVICLIVALVLIFFIIHHHKAKGKTIAKLPQSMIPNDNYVAANLDELHIYEDIRPCHTYEYCNWRYASGESNVSVPSIADKGHLEVDPTVISNSILKTDQCVTSVN